MTEALHYSSSQTGVSNVCGLALSLTSIVGVGVHVQVGVLLGLIWPPNHTPDLPPLQPHQIREMGVVLALLAQGGVERGRGGALLPLQQLGQERRLAAAPEASDAGASGQQPRCQAQASALLVPPWQPAELPGDEEGD